MGAVVMSLTPFAWNEVRAVAFSFACVVGTYGLPVVIYLLLRAA